MSPRHRLLAPSLLLVSLGGCSKGCGNDHPYVPYSIEGGGSIAQADAAALPAPVEDAGACLATQRLAQIGKRSLLVEIGHSCARPRGPSRWFSLMRMEKGAAKVQLGVLLFDPAGAAKMTLDADGADQDGDGIDDLVL